MVVANLSGNNVGGTKQQQCAFYSPSFLACASLLAASATAGSFESSIFPGPINVQKRDKHLSQLARLISYSVIVRGRFETTGFFSLSLSFPPRKLCGCNSQSADVCKAPRCLRANRMFDSVLPCACVTRANCVLRQKTSSS